MKIWRDLKHLNKNAVYTIGNFDGLHRGHFDLLGVTVSKAKQKKMPAVLVSFYPHPRNVLAKADKPKKIYSLRKTAQLLNGFGIDEMIFLRFSKEFAATPYQDFLAALLKKGDTLILGQDACLGSDRQGNSKAIATWALNSGVEFQVVTLKTIDGEKIGSGAVRETIANGEVDRAREILGRPFSLYGSVVHGDARGRQLGFPTANMKVSSKRIAPKKGVYATTTIVDGKQYKSITNIGTRPTFDCVHTTLAETHIFDFDQDIYGKKIEVFLHKYIREEKKFSSKEELVKQIAHDCEVARK